MKKEIMLGLTLTYYVDSDGDCSCDNTGTYLDSGSGKKQ